MAVRTCWTLLILLAPVACSDPVASVIPLELDAEVVVDEGQLHYSLIATNPSNEPVIVRRVCSFGWNGVSALRVYDPQDTVSPRWDHRLLHPDVPCIGAPGSIPVMGGERSALDPRSVSVAEILGDSIPPGTYRLAVLGQFEPELPVMEVVVGEFLLTQ